MPSKLFQILTSITTSPSSSICLSELSKVQSQDTGVINTLLQLRNVFAPSKCNPLI